MCKPWRVVGVLVVLALVGGAGGRQAQAGSEDRVRTLMRRMDQLYRSESSHTVMSMEVKTKHYQRALRLEGWTRGRHKSLVVIRAPKKDQGVATLKVDRNIWSYLPKIDRETKIPPSMMMGSWMGSHFTNDDLVRESSYEEDYTASITFEGQREGREVIEVTLLPRPNAPVVWGKVIMELTPHNILPLSMTYFDEEGTKTRIMTFEGVKNMGGRLLPTRMVLIPMDKPEESTVVTYQSAAFDVGVPDELFSLEGLRKKAGGVR